MDREVLLKALPSATDLYGKSNGDVFIIGAGCSLHMMNLSPLKSKDCCFVNASAILMPVVGCDSAKRYWCSVDRLCTRWSYFWEYVVKEQCERLVSDDWIPKHNELSKFNVRYFTAHKDKDVREDSICGVSSIPASIDLMMRFGYRRIFLLGVDHRMMYRNKSHFWQLWPKEKWPRRSDMPDKTSPEPIRQQVEMFNKNIPVFRSLSEHASSIGVEIFNCSAPISVLDVFLPMPLDKAVSR